MFWGLIMEPQRRYSQVVKRPFHISMAALDASTSDDNPTQVICTFDERNYLLCTLNKGQNIQMPLDLNFELGDQISFATNGKAHVHLTGYLLEDQSLVEEEEEPDYEDADKEISETNILTKKRRSKPENLNSPPKKKSKTLELLEQVNSNDEDDSDDSDVNMSDLLEEEDADTTGIEEVDEEDEEDEAESEDENAEEEESDEDAQDEEDEEEDDSSSMSDDEEKIQKQTKKPLENGVPGKKADKKLKQKQQMQQSPQRPNQQDNQQQKKQKNEKQQQKIDKAAKGDKTPAKGDKTPAKTDKTPGKGDKTPAKSPKQEGGATPQKKTMEGGVIIEDLRVGNGQAAKPGKFVKVYYEGRFKSNNKMFDSTTKGSGFEFRLGKQEVIKGWDVGVAGMKVGGKRRIVCPPNMAYGSKGSPPTIPPNSTLVFEVELKNVK